jgi:hypothetical protein
MTVIAGRMIRIGRGVILTLMTRKALRRYAAAVLPVYMAANTTGRHMRTG